MARFRAVCDSCGHETILSAPKFAAVGVKSLIANCKVCGKADYRLIEALDAPKQGGSGANSGGVLSAVGNMMDKRAERKRQEKAAELKYKKQEAYKKGFKKAYNKAMKENTKQIDAMVSAEKSRLYMEEMKRKNAEFMNSDAGQNLKANKEKIAKFVEHELKEKSPFEVLENLFVDYQNYFIVGFQKLDQQWEDRERLKGGWDSEKRSTNKSLLKTLRELLISEIESFEDGVKRLKKKKVFRQDLDTYDFATQRWIKNSIVNLFQAYIRNTGNWTKKEEDQEEFVPRDTLLSEQSQQNLADHFIDHDFSYFLIH